MGFRPKVLFALASTLIGIAGSSALAQSPSRPLTQHIVDLWQESAGLPQNYVSVILQTRDGYIWVGTRSGAARFDGVRFTTYDDRRPGQLRESEVWALAEDDDGAVWIGTYGGGLSCFQNGKFTTYTTEDGLPSNLITALVNGPDGRLWIGTVAGLVARRQGRFERFAPNDGLPQVAVRALHRDKDGVVWVGTDQGLASYSNARFFNHTRASPAQLTGQVSAIAGNLEGGLWLAIRPPGSSGDGVRRLQGDSIASFTMHDGLPSNIVMSVVTLENGTVWIGTRQGLCRYAGGRFETYFSDVWGAVGEQMLEHASLQGIPALATDREGNLWFGTRLDGLGRLREGLFLSVTGGDVSGQGVDVRTLREDADGAMWLGTAHDLRRIKGESVTIYRYGPESGAPADALTFDRDGVPLIGSSGGLMRLRSGRIEPHPVVAAAGLDVSLLFTDAQGNVWIGTRDNGAYRLSGTTLTPFTAREGLLGGQVRGIAQDRDGSIWIGTRDGGVSRLREGRFTTFGPREGLAGPAVQSLFVDHDGAVWAGTRQGLNRIRGDRVAVITAQQGLPANYFYEIIEDDAEHLWLTYARGIARVPRKELDAVADGQAKVVRPVLFGTESGMKSTTMTLAHQPAAWKAADGRLWFGTARGAEVIDPRFTIRNAIAPPVLIEGLSIDRQLRPVSDGLALDPTRGEIAIQYTGLSFVAPNRVLFKYRLEGFDPDWVEAGTRRVAYYSNLRHGDYRFRVIACNNDGVWNEAGASLSFRVLPRWHERTWVRALGVGLVGFIVLGLHRMRVARLRRRERELATRVEERTHALQELTSNLEHRVSERTAELATANEALSAEKERLAVTLGSIGDGVIATDVKSHVVLMNRVAEQVTGWTEGEAVGLPLGDILRTVDRYTRQPLPDPARDVLERGKVAGTASTCLLRARDQREILVANSAAPIRDPSSRVVGAVFVVRDITDRERMEEQLRNTQRLEALAVLAGGIAHDFNNLLTGIFGFVDVARDRASEPEHVREMMQRAVGVLEKARGLTGQLLTFSKAGEPVRRPTQLGPLVRDTVGFVLSGSNVVADIQVADDLWPCEVDEQQIGQVVDNLIINARQAMPSGGSIVVRLRNVYLPDDILLDQPAGPFVCLSVRDQGPGIPRDLWPKVFEPFFTTKPGGSGLGLATVHSIVRRHGGHVELDSEPGVGTAFDVFLPASPRSVVATPPRAATAAPKVVVRGSGRVLVMDDEEYVREVARQMLKRLGFDAILASDDREAVALLRQARERGEQVEVAILDMTIPGGLGGAAALERLRSEVPDLPAIASSGYSGDAIMARPEDHGFVATLPKPYTMEDLRRVMSEALGLRSGETR